MLNTRMIARFSSIGDRTVKTILFVLCLLSAAAAFAQNVGARNNQPNVYSFQSTSAHATYAPMLQEQSVLPNSTYWSAQGERRPSDFHQPDEISLGAAARELRKQREELKKSRVVWINQ